MEEVALKTKDCSRSWFIKVKLSSSGLVNKRSEMTKGRSGRKKWGSDSDELSMNFSHFESVII